ncbi:MAG: sugar phosphate isomerase/epimerase [Oscillospiraceae bacterium]|nr:sugar phosphate isomerase/epimerase [Oscillospiraceae bacterium]
MSVGISTACFYPEISENAVRFLCENGVSNIEIFFNSACELNGDIFKEICACVKENGTRVVSVHPFSSAFEPFMLFSDYERRFSDGLEFYKNYFEACNTLGAKILVLHGDRADRTNCDERYFDRYHRLYTAAKEAGITLAQENVCYCRSHDTAFLKAMRASLKDEVAFVLDLKQARRANIDYHEYVEAMGERLIHLHANDFDEEHDCLLPGKGKLDFGEVYRALGCVGFKGESIVEVYRGNYGKPYELIESMHYLERFENKK